MKIKCNTCGKIVCANEYNAQFCSYQCEQKWKETNTGYPRFIKVEGSMNNPVISYGSKTIVISVSENNKYLITYTKFTDDSIIKQPLSSVYVAETTEEVGRVVVDILSK